MELIAWSSTFKFLPEPLLEMLLLLLDARLLSLHRAQLSLEVLVISFQTSLMISLVLLYLQKLGKHSRRLRRRR